MANSTPSTLRFTGAALVSVAALGASQTASAATASPIMLDYSSIVGTGASIRITRLPIQLPDGSTIYKDLTVVLKTSTTGVISAGAKPVQVLSPTLLVSNFQPGVYQNASDTRFGFVLTGPGVISGSNNTTWSINATAGESSSGQCGVPAIFYTGSAASNPYAARLAAAGISDPKYSYGLIGTPSVCGTTYAANALVGVAQIGNQLEIASFTDNTGHDHNTAVDHRTYTLKP